MIPGLALIEDQMSFYNVRRSGNSYNAATLLASITDLGDTECVAYLPKGLTDTQTIWTIDQSINFPENISVLIPCGVIINVLSGIDIVFQGPLLTQCPIWKTGPGNAYLLQKTAINSHSYKDFFDPFIVAGGIHGLSPTCFSPTFYTEAYVANGQYILEEYTSINYGSLGANCLEDWVWVIIAYSNTPTILGTNFINVPGTHYYVDFTSTERPNLPPDSAYLMELHLYNDTINIVNDMRNLDAAQGLLNRIPYVNWTPYIRPGNYTYSAQSGVYVNMGHLIYITGYIEISDVITPGGPGPLEIISLPYDWKIPGTFSSGGVNFHIASGIKSLYGPSSFSGFIPNGLNVIQIAETIVSHVYYYIVAADRVMPGAKLGFSGMYILT